MKNRKLPWILALPALLLPTAAWAGQAIAGGGGCCPWCC